MIRYHVPLAVLDGARDFFRRRGAQGFEGTALLAGRLTAPGQVLITRLVIPQQVAETTPWGARVDLTKEAHLTLTDLLEPGELYYARIHSHPGAAFHSDRDDANPVLSHEGAISIVVPYFAREPIELTGCAVFRLARGQGWLSLDNATIREVFTITTETP
jgi:hypothetical protein